MSRPDYEFCTDIGCPKIYNECTECSLKNMLGEYKKYFEIGTVTELEELVKREKVEEDMHAEAYKKRLEEEETSWNILTDEEKENEIPFPLTNDGISLAKLETMMPKDFLAVTMNLFTGIKGYSNSVYNWKSWPLAMGIRNSKFTVLASWAYKQMGDLVKKCVDEYNNVYTPDKKVAVIEMLSEFPEARYQIICYFSEIEKAAFYTNKELRERKEKRELDAKSGKTKNKKLKHFGAVAKFRRLIDEYGLNNISYYSEFLDMDSEALSDRIWDVNEMGNDIKEKCHYDRQYLAIDMMIENMPDFQTTWELMKEWGPKISRAELIAASDTMFDEYVESYKTIKRQEIKESTIDTKGLDKEKAERVKKAREKTLRDVAKIRSYGYNVVSTGINQRYGDYELTEAECYKIALDKNSEKFFFRNKTIVEMRSDIAKKYHCKTLAAAMDMLVKDNQCFKEAREFLKDEYRTMTRAEVIAASDLVFEQYEDAYNSLMTKAMEAEE